MVHEKASVGFSRSVDAYDRGRPDYSDQAIRFLRDQLVSGVRGPLTVLDLGAGTGKFTRYLTEMADEKVGDVIAVEPLAAMRDRLAAKFPTVRALDGTAEAVPMADASVDAVTVAQAFHWFDGAKALPEIRRVLRPGGLLALVWNLRDEEHSESAWVRALSEILDRHEAGVPRYKSMRWKHAFEHLKLFDLKAHKSFPYTQVGDVETMIDRMASISFIAAMEPVSRAAVIEDIRTVYQRALRPDGKIAMPYQTHIYIYRPSP